jgi:hypothetical protein
MGERLMTGATPTPERPTVCGLPPALSVMVTDAVRLPLAVGVNITLIVQLPPAASELPHVFVCAKSPAFAPVIAMLDRLKPALPVLPRVTVWGALVEPTAWFPKARLAGERLALGSNG